MTIERELLKRVISGDDDGDFFISHRLYKDIETFLAQPEQDKAEAVMPNSVCVSNVYDAYEEGRKSVMSEQDPVAWMYEWVNEIGEHVKSVVYNFYDDANLIPLYTAPPKREPLTPQQISEGNQSMLNVTREAFKQGVIFAEKAHGIGGGE